MVGYQRSDEEPNIDRQRDAAKRRAPAVGRSPDDMMNAGILFLCFLGASFTLASVGYALLSHLQTHVFAGLFRMFMYHEEHPYQYIGLTAIVYAIIATTWATTLGSRTKGYLRCIGILAIFPTTILIASFPGGMLWSWHDMQAGFVPAYWMDKLFSQGMLGVETGWLVIALSFPYNLLGLIIGCVVTDQLEKHFRRTSASTVRLTRGGFAVR